MDLFAIYLLLINALGLCLMLTDKHRAKKNLQRIPERILLAVAVFGGSFGVVCGMRLAHHKTRKGTFSVCVPVLLALQILFLIFSLIFTKNV